MRMSLCTFSTSGVWEATGVVAGNEFGGPMTFLGTSSFLEISGINSNGFAILEDFMIFEADRSLVYSAGVCGKAVGVTA